jgi:hypothetical protein
MSAALLSLVTKQHHKELRWWALCRVQGDAPSRARSWAARVSHTLISPLPPAPAQILCCA